MTTMGAEPITGLEAWLGAEIERSADRIRKVPAPAVVELDAALRDLEGRGLAWPRFACAAHDKIVHAPMWKPAFLNDVGSRVQESGFGLISGHANSAPYEDVSLKGDRRRMTSGMLSCRLATV